jgi:hypothetical protein
MRALLGFLVLHAAMTVTGISLLRAFGFLTLDASFRSVVLASGPALLAGLASVVPVMTILLVVGVPVTPASATVTCAGIVAVAEAVARRARRRLASGAATGHRSGASTSSMATRGYGLAGATACAYATAVAFLLARLPTTGDDARIWSLRGLTLTYYHGLQPEIFQAQAQSGGHPVYPLFQPVLEALVNQALGAQQLRFFHAELWLLLLAAVWSCAYLIVRHIRFDRRAALWLAPLVLLLVTPAVIRNQMIGDADVTGSMMLATGTLALSIWLEHNDRSALALGTVLLAAAASTKDEDFVGAVIVLVIASAMTLLRAHVDPVEPQPRPRPQVLGACALTFAVLGLPWRIWVAAHHLTDSVEPHFPQALSPSFILGRTHQLHEAASAMLAQMRTEWGWLAAIFIVACLVSMNTRTTRQAARFYLAAFVAIAISLLWLYTTTHISLAFLLPTSTSRTIDVFMVLAAPATAHLLAPLISTAGPTRSSTLSR